MWNVLKFFFFWFWLALASFLAGLWLLGQLHPGGSAKPGDGADAVVVFLVPVLMSIPAYLLARPKRVQGSAEELFR